MKQKQYSVEDMRALLDSLSSLYDLARVVDPIEGRILHFREDGTISREERCYGIWNSERKCVNCSSAVASRTGCSQRKSEYFQDRVFHIESSPVTLSLPDGGVYDAVMELVTVEAEARAEAPGVNDRASENGDHAAAERQSQLDGLTKALNEDAFFECCREAIDRQPERSWVMLTANIRDFRLINTLFGVLRGNEVLVRTAEMLRELAAEARGFCGRLGADQFALLLPGAGFREDALHRAARSLREEFSSGVYTFCLHFGVYAIEDASLPVSVMCDRASAALRTVRDDLTRAVAWFDGEMLQKSLFEQEVISSFEEALREGQFQMYLQPLAAADGHIYGGEALARWLRPDGTLIPPGSFIETLERAGLIHRLDMFMWELAVKQLRRWQDGPQKGLTISVNLSAKDFYSVDVYEVLTGLVDKYGVDSGMLRLEITETALLEEPEEIDAMVARLHKRGFLVEIDDFGKGNSSLSLLKDIQADVLKIDMSLLREMENKRRSRIVLESIIHMANSLGMDVITEGVETLQQFRSLSAMGCGHFQGYYFSRPLPVEEFEEKYTAKLTDRN